MSASVATLLIFVVAFVASKILQRSSTTKIETVGKDFALKRSERYEFEFRVSFEDREVAESFQAAVATPSVVTLVKSSENGLRWVVEGKATSVASFSWYRSIIIAWTGEMACRPGASGVVIATASKLGMPTGLVLSTDIANGV